MSVWAESHLMSNAFTTTDPPPGRAKMNGSVRAGRFQAAQLARSHVRAHKRSNNARIAAGNETGRPVASIEMRAVRAETRRAPVSAFAADFSNQILSQPVNKLAETAEFVTGLEWRIKQFRHSLNGNDRDAT